MEQIVQKPPLPIKTKIAALWMGLLDTFFLIISGIITGLYFLVSLNLLAGAPKPPSLSDLVYLIPLLPLYNLFSSIFILKGKKWAWLSAVILHSILLFSIIFLCFARERVNQEYVMMGPFKLFIISIGVIIAIPLILLLLDRKNFWKVAS